MKTNIIIHFTVLIIIALWCYIFGLTTFQNCYAQGIAINNTSTSADASAILDINTTNQGVLIPRITSIQRNAIPTPATGLIVYNTTTNKFNYYNGTEWYEIETTYVSSAIGTVSMGSGISVNINSNLPDSSAILDINNSTRGLLIPRLNGTGIISSPATGLLIYNTTTNKFNYYNGSGWIVPCATTTGVGGFGGSQSNIGIAVNIIGLNPDASAILDISSDNKGILIPRLSTTNRNNIKPVTGLTIYNTTSNSIEYYNGSAWYMLEKNAPVVLGTIDGINTVCKGQSGLQYSITSISNATSYSWVYSGTGATINGTTNPVTVDFNGVATSGNLTVIGINACGNGASSPNYPITVNSTPAAAGAISGNATVCQGQSGVQYSVAAISGATSYSWIYSGTGATINGTTNPVTIDFNGAATSGNLTVIGINACGNGVTSPNYAITVNTLPSAPTALNPSGESVCEFNARWTSVAGATHYHLDVSTSPFFSSGWIENNLDVGNVTSYNIDGVDPGDTYYYRVRAENNCGTSPNSNRENATTDDDPCVAATFDEDAFGGGSFWTITYTATSNGYVKEYRYGSDCYNPTYQGYVYVTIGDQAERACASGCCGVGDIKWVSGCCPASCPCPW